jgi:hypothetical protein
VTSIIWSPHALRDVEAVRQYIAQDSAHYAELVVARIAAAVERLPHRLSRWRRFRRNRHRLPSLASVPRSGVNRRPNKGIWTPPSRPVIPQHDRLFPPATVHSFKRPPIPDEQSIVPGLWCSDSQGRRAL